MTSTELEKGGVIENRPHLHPAEHFWRRTKAGIDKLHLSDFGVLCWPASPYPWPNGYCVIRRSLSPVSPLHVSRCTAHTEDEAGKSALYLLAVEKNNAHSQFGH